MDGTRALSDSSSVAAEGAEAVVACPNCGQTAGALSAVRTSLFPADPLRRCSRCGARFCDGHAARVVLSCSECGLPFVGAEPSPREEHSCPDCLAGRIPADLPDREVAEATEREVRLALENEWSFVSAPSLSLYLNRLAGQICRRVEPAPENSLVMLFEDAHWRTLALPSGTVLMSVGKLVALEDEAELTFVLAHELAHAAAADAAVRLVRVGLHVVALENRGALGQSWSYAALDLIRLGYGRARELEADRQALDAVMAMGYDPESVVRYLRRLQASIDRGDARIADLALAHPTPVDRLRHVEQLLSARPEPRVKRVNREVFRRAAGHSVLSSSLERVEKLEAAAEDTVEASAQQEKETAERSHRRFWLMISAVLLVTALAVLGWFVFLN